jgi:hypothetical protein
VTDSGGTVNPITKVYKKRGDPNSLSSVTVKGKDEMGNAIYLVFFRDPGANHLHIKVPPNYYWSAA